MGRALLLAACLLIASVAAPVIAGETLDLFNQPTQPPVAREAEIAHACTTGADYARWFLEGIALNPRAIREARIGAARVAACYDDPGHVDVVWLAFLESKLDVAAHDPDIFERHLRTLQRMPRDAVNEALLATPPGPVVTMVWSKLLGSWLAPLAEQAGNAESFAIRKNPAVQAAAEEVVHAWTAQLVAQPEGLVRLQTDSGDAAFELLEQVGAVLVAELIRAGSDEEVALALELVRQRVPAGPVITEAIAERLERRPNPRLAELAADLPPLPAFQVRRGSKLYPVEPLPEIVVESILIDARAEASPEARHRVPIGPVLAAVGLGSFALWLLLLRLLPARRQLLFRLAAVLLAPAALVLLEAALALVGYHPLIAQRPSFDPTRAPRVFAEELLVGGDEAVRMTDADARSAIFPRRSARKRVVTFGGSSVHGTHYLAEEAFSAHLERRLQAAGDVEVINAGVGGVLSDHVVDNAFTAIGRWDPDLLVFYLGNNDLEHLHSQVGFRAFDPEDLVARYVVDRLRVARLLRSVLPGSLLDRAADAGPEGAMLDPDESPEARSTVARLARWNATWNLVRAAERAHAEGVAVLFVVQGQNDEACPPEPERITPDCFQHELRRIAVDAAAATDSPVVDGAGALRAHAGGPAGYVYYWDQIHPTRLGHAVLGAAIAPEAARLLEL